MRPYLVQHLLEDSCQRYPDKICIASRTKSLSYQEVLQQSQTVAAMLCQFPIHNGDHIGIFLDKSAEQVLSMLGVLYAGCVFVILNPILKDEQISHIITDCKIKTIVTSHSRISKRASVFINAGISNALVFDGTNGYGFANEKICDDNNLKSTDTYAGKDLRMTDDTSHIIYTSGSTGMPKGIVVSHRNTIDGAKIVSSYTTLVPEDKMLGALPFNFDYGMNQLINTLYMGATLYLYDFLMPNNLLSTLEREKITVFAGMTPNWAKIFNPKLTDLSKTYDFSVLRVITNTGGKVPVNTVKKMRELFPATKIYLMYGLTEAFRSTYLDPDEIDRRPDSMGKAIPNVQIMVINKDGMECGPHEEGELVHRGALITKGYWNNPEKTNEVFKPNPLLGEQNAHLETVVFSGDIVRKDDDGFLYYIGRKDHMIKTKGYRVSPSEVEELISKMDGVNECVAAGYELDDEILLRVFVTLNSNNDNKEDIILQCKRDFPFYLVPDDVIILKSFPLTANGKTDRNRIIAEYEKFA